MLISDSCILSPVEILLPIKSPTSVVRACGFVPYLEDFDLEYFFFSGGYTEVTTNRTTFPLSGGFFSIKTGHPNWTGSFFPIFDEKSVY